MVGLEGLALGAVPLVGGLLVGGMAGKGGPSGQDLRAVIKSEMDLLERIPGDQVTRRAALEQVIAQHIDALVVAIEKSRDLKRKTSYFVQNWRDLVLLLTTVCSLWLLGMPTIIVRSGFRSSLPRPCCRW